MKLLILIAICAGALSVPLENQNDPLAEFIQKVLEANPLENDIGGGDDTISSVPSVDNKKEKTLSDDNAVENSEFKVRGESESSTDVPAIDVDIATETAEGLDVSIINPEVSKTNISKSESKNNKGEVKEEISDNIVTTDSTLISMEEEMTIPSVEMNEMRDSIRFDEDVPQTDNMYENTPISGLHEDNYTDYDEDAVSRIPLDGQESWNPNIHQHDTHEGDNSNMFESLGKDYADHMTMLENPFLSPVDTLPLDPSLMEGTTRNEDHHGSMSPDYPYYDYMDETGTNFGLESNNNNTDLEIVSNVVNETLVMEDTLPTEDTTPSVVEMNDALTTTDNYENLPAENQDPVESEQLLSNDEIPTLNNFEINEQQQPIEHFDSMDKNNDIQSEMSFGDEHFDMSSIKEPHSSDLIGDFNPNTFNINNGQEFNAQNDFSDSTPISNNHQNLYGNMDDMHDFNPYTFQPNNFDEILYRSLLQEENAYRMNQYASHDDFYPDGSSSVFHTNANADNSYDQNESNYHRMNEKMTIPIPENDNSGMEGSIMQENLLPNINDDNYNQGKERDLVYSVADSDYTPMAGVLPVTRQTPVVEIAQEVDTDNSAPTNYNNREQDISFLLYNTLLRNLEQSSQNYDMSKFVSNPSRSNSPHIVFVDSASKNSVDNDMMVSSNQVPEIEDQQNQIDNTFINEDGTLLTDIQHNVNIPYAPGYHPEYFPTKYYYNKNQYPFGYRTTSQPMDMTTNYYPYSSNYFNSYPSQYSDLGYYNGYYPQNHFQNRHYDPYSAHNILNYYALRDYYRKQHLNNLYNYYY